MNNLRGLLLASKEETGQKEVVMIGFESVDTNEAALEAAGYEREIAVLEQNIDQLNGIYDGLEALVDQAETTLEDGGMDRQAALMLTAGANGLLAPLEIAAPCPAVESFGGVGERMGSTRVAVESIGSVLSDIWEAIKKAIQDMRKKLEAWYKSMFNTATKIKERAEKLSMAAGKVSGGKKEDKFEFKLGILTTTANKDGDKVKETMGALVNQATDHLITTPDAFKGYATDFMASYKAVAVSKDDEIAEARTSIADAYKTLATKVSNKVGNKTATSAKVKNKSIADTDGVSYRFGEELPGNRILTTADFKEGADTDAVLKNANRIGARLVTFDEDAEKDNDAIDITVPATSVIQDICEECIKIAETISKHEATNKKLDKAKSEFVKIGDEFQKKAAKTEATNQGSQLSSIQKMPQNIIRMLDNPSADFVKLYVGAANHALNFCQAALKQYK